MNFIAMKNRIAANLNRDDLGIYVADWINEIRDKICKAAPLYFTLTKTIIPLASGKNSYFLDDLTTAAFTASKALATITATAGTFTANDIGKYFRWGTTGQVDKITGYTSGTAVTVENSGTIASQAGTLIFPRFSGLHQNVIFNNAGALTKLPYVEPQLFDMLFPLIETGNPTAYTIRGNEVILNKSLTTVTNISLNVKFYELPALLEYDNNEQYLDKKYYKAIIAGASSEGAAFARDTEITTYWQNVFSEELKNIIDQDKGIAPVAVTLRRDVGVAPA